jgi:hypothetical protein
VRSEEIKEKAAGIRQKAKRQRQKDDSPKGFFVENLLLTPHSSLLTFHFYFLTSHAKH